MNKHFSIIIFVFAGFMAQATVAFAYSEEGSDGAPSEVTTAPVDTVTDNKAPDCFSASTNPIIGRQLFANAKYHEDKTSIAAIHKLIWDHRDEIDPRLVYYRMLGESKANPEAKNPSSGAYGMFQFLGKPYGSKRTHKAIVQALIAANPKESPRLIQTRYYLENYLASYIKGANQGYGCKELKHKKFAQYTNIEKVSYLGWGSCSAGALKKEKQLCVSNQSYKDGPCQLTHEVMTGKNFQPVCGSP